MGKRKTAFPNLAAEMRRRGETQTDLAKLLGLNSYSSISAKMNGYREFRLCEVEAICKHYAKSFEELFIRGD